MTGLGRFALALLTARRPGRGPAGALLWPLAAWIALSVLVPQVFSQQDRSGHGAVPATGGRPPSAVSSVSASTSSAPDTASPDEDDADTDSDSDSDDETRTVGIGLSRESGLSAFIKGKTLVVPADQTERGDRYFVGQEARIDGTLDGDLFACGETVSVKGTVTGDVNAAGSKVRISGTVTDDVRAAGSDVEVSGRIGGDLIGMGQNVLVETGSVVEGRTLAFAGRVRLAGEFKGPIKAGAGQIDFSGTADGNVELEADAIDFDPNARILGDLKYTARNELEIFKHDAEAGKRIVSGTVTFAPRVKEKKKRGFSGFWFLFQVWTFFAAYIVGCLVIAIARGTVSTIVRTGQEEALKSIGYGVLGHIFAPFAGLVLLALCLTAPIAMLVFLAWTGLFYLAKLVTALTVTDWLMRRAGFHPSPYLALLLGMIALWIFFMVPFLGVLLYWFFVPIFGIGATLVGLRERWNSRHVSAPPQDPAAAQALA